MAIMASGKIRPLAALVARDADGPERGDAEDDVGDEHDAEALEQVGGHAGAVADVVADVVGDGGGVAGVVLGDAGLDLADQVGADVGRLGEDAAADAEEQGEQRAAEAEADEDRRRGVLEDHHDEGGAQQAEAGGEQARRCRRRGTRPAWRRPSMPVLAAAAVRTLARVASHMPRKPMKPENERARRGRPACGTRPDCRTSRPSLGRRASGPRSR